MIKSDIGDIKNTGGRWGGAITAAEFLKVFVEDTPGFTSTSPAWPGWKTPSLGSPKAPAASPSARFWSG